MKRPLPVDAHMFIMIAKYANNNYDTTIIHVCNDYKDEYIPLHREFVRKAVHPSLQCLIVTLELCPEKD